MSKVVVFVDDSATVLMSAEMILESMVENGVLELITYSNPLDVLSDVEAGTLKYDLLITDINMPQMNGIDLIAKLKKQDALKAKPILALTTENSPEMKQYGKSVGLNGWITKPFSEAKIMSAIKRVLKIR